MPSDDAIHLPITVEFMDPPTAWPATDPGRAAARRLGEIRDVVVGVARALGQIDADGRRSLAGKFEARREVLRTALTRAQQLRDEAETARDRSLGRRLELVRELAPDVDAATRTYLWHHVERLNDLDRTAYLLSGVPPIVAAAVLSAPPIAPWTELPHEVRDNLTRRAIGPAGAERLAAWERDREAIEWTHAAAVRAHNRAAGALGGAAEPEPRPEPLTVAQVLEKSGVPQG